jgi:hypothetical protein
LLAVAEEGACVAIALAANANWTEVSHGFRATNTTPEMSHALQVGASEVELRSVDLVASLRLKIVRLREVAQICDGTEPNDRALRSCGFFLRAFAAGSIR